MTCASPCSADAATTAATGSSSRALLLERGLDVGVYLLGQAADVKGDARTNLTVLRNLGVDVVEIADAGAWELHGIGRARRGSHRRRALRHRL